jgi:predicted ATPase/DNA-binding CsgD family transcriptional regulator
MERTRVTATIAGRVPVLPHPLTSFVGRDAEVAAACALLRSSDVRLLTLTGPGGVGKTRLALSVAHKLAGGFASEIAVVSLAPISDPRLVLPTVAQALGVREAPNRPLIDQLTLALGERRRLLVLDNLEQVVAAAPEVATLLDACPRLTILATSRVPLRISGEQEYSVPPLGLQAAVALFVERARAARPDFALTDAIASAVADVCRRLDGLPLAIELAAARAKVLSPQALLVRLSDRLRLLTGGPRDLPARQRTLRDAVAWSHDLLTPEEQALFRRLAVFAGGFTLEAAEHVTGGQTSVSPTPPAPLPPSVLDGVASLVDKSLLRVDDGGPEPRFTMLETVREYGLERLEFAGEAESTRRRHAAWVLAFAVRAEARHFDADGPAWLDRLDVEADNIRNAFEFLTRGEDVEGTARLAIALRKYWTQRGHLREGQGWSEWLLTRADALRPAIRAAALLVAASLAENRNDHERAAELGDASLLIARGNGDRLGVAGALHLLGLAAMRRGRSDRATAYLVEAIESYRVLGHTPWLAAALSNLAMVAYRQGELEAATELAEEAVRLNAQTRFAWGGAQARFVVAEIARLQGDTARAGRLLRESLVIYHEQREIWGTIECLVPLAAVAAAAGQPAAAGRLFGAAESLCGSIGADLLATGGETELATDALRPLFDVPAFAAGRATGQAQTPDQILAKLPNAIRDAPEPAPAPPAGDGHGLTAREREVLVLLARGSSNQEIAVALGISALTVKTHVTSILAKLKLPSRAAAATYVHRHGHP